jgi:hypothetical protein
MKSAVLELQTAIKALLVAGMPTATIYDGAPRNAPVPFVSLDEIVTRRKDGLDAMIEEHRFSIRVWSKAGGKTEAVTLADAVITLLDDAQPTMPDHRVIRLYLDTSDSRAAKDRIAVETTLRFVALTQPLNVTG